MTVLLLVRGVAVRNIMDAVSKDVFYLSVRKVTVLTFAGNVTNFRVKEQQNCLKKKYIKMNEIQFL